MIQQFKTHIKEVFPFLEGKNLLVAISGGLDSVVLIHLLVALEMKNTTIALAHCNFQLRGQESDTDEEFVRHIAQNLGLQLFVKKFDTQQYAQEQKLSVQLSARALRYRWFNQLLATHHQDYVLTAHHADDNLETFLINLTRGTGLEGLTGIPHHNQNIVRPLLPFSREEIKSYAVKHQIQWREDSSNAETKYLRNAIRHTVIPSLKEVAPSLLSNFKKTVTYLQQSQQIIEDRMNAVSKDLLFKEQNVLKIDITKIKQLSDPKAYLYQLLKPYHFTEWDNVYALLSAQSGKYICSDTHRLLKDRQFLLLSAIITPTAEPNFYLVDETVSLTALPIPLTVKKVDKIVNNSKNTIFVNKNLVIFPLVLRRWSEGDVFFPTGMKGKKKISKYFKDEKYTLIDKENSWLLCSNTNEVIWIVGKRQDRRFLATNKTKDIIKISI